MRYRVELDEKEPKALEEEQPVVPRSRCQRDVGKEKRPGKYVGTGGRMDHWARHHKTTSPLFQSIQVSLGESLFPGPRICPSIQLKLYTCVSILFLLLQILALPVLKTFRLLYMTNISRFRLFFTLSLFPPWSKSPSLIWIVMITPQWHLAICPSLPRVRLTRN